MTKPSSVSREERARLGGLKAASNHTPEERRQKALERAAKLTPEQKRRNALTGGRGRAAKYSSQQLSQMHAGQLSKRLAKMSPEEARERQSKAGAARWRGVDPQERSRISRRGIQLRWARIAYSENPAPVDRLLAFLNEFVDKKGYCPAIYRIAREMHQDSSTVTKRLRTLEALGLIQRQAWCRGGITITRQEPALMENAPLKVMEAEIYPEPPVVRRRGRKCYDCDALAVEGKARCEAHLKRVSEACLRARAK